MQCAKFRFIQFFVRLSAYSNYWMKCAKVLTTSVQCTFVTICSIQPRCWEYAAKINGQQLKIFSESVMVRFEKKNDVPLITWIVIRCFFLSLLSAALFFFNVSYVLSSFIFCTIWYLFLPKQNETYPANRTIHTSNEMQINNA